MIQLETTVKTKVHT